MGSFNPENSPAENQVADIQDYGDVDAGAVLRRAREHYGLSLDDVEKHLHIRRSYLEAIEQNQPDVLPGRVYAIGFIRSYAEFLGLDGGKIIQIYKRHLHEKDRPEFHVPIEASESKLPSPRILAASAAVLVLVVGLFIVMQGHETDNEVPKADIVLSAVDQKPLEPQLEIDFTTLGQIAPAAGTMPLMDEAEAEEKPSRIVIYAQESAWVEVISDKGEELLSKVLKPGDRYDVPDRAGLLLTTGNIGGLVLTLDGHNVSALGEAGQKLKNMKLTPASLQPHLEISGN